MEKILFIGNSITEGSAGISYVKFLKKILHNYNIINKGRGGDTLIGIFDRLFNIINEEKKFKIIIIEAGHNDIILPYLLNGRKKHKAVANLISQRSIPIEDNEEFENHLRKSLKRLKSRVESQIFITTLSCIGENLVSKLNLRRQDLNEIIVRIADEIKINVIDIGKEFNESLRNKKTSGYLLGENVSTTLIDTLKVRNNEKSSLELSKKRGLHLTIDGVHLNANGAEIYKNSIYIEIVKSL